MSFDRDKMMRKTINDRKFVIIPYVCYDGSWSFSDGYLRSLWKDMVDQEVHTQVYYDGSIKTGDDFLRIMKAPGNITHITIEQTPEGNQAAQVAWINSINKCSAYVHYFTVPRVWGGPTLELSRMGLLYWATQFKKDNEPMFDTFIGCTPTHLRAAQIFLRKTGFHVLGVIPNSTYDHYNNKKVGSAISYITREEILKWVENQD